MKLFPLRKRTVELIPAPGISLRLPSGVSHSRNFGHTGIWRKTACFAILNSTIREYPCLFRDVPPISFIWSEKTPLTGNTIPIYCEHGWLPRAAYQISTAGCNQHHPVARLLADDCAKLPDPTAADLMQLEKLKRNCAPAASPADLCGKPFFLFALQVVNDLNLERCGLEYACLAKSRNAPHALLMCLSAMIAERAPGARVLFLQHPAEKACGSTNECRLPANHEFVPNSRKLRSMDLLLSPNCRGLISINSNALNEAMLFSKPTYQIGDFLMSRFPNRHFPHPLEEFLRSPERCLEPETTTRYLATLINHQHTLADLADPHGLRDLILRETARHLAPT